MKKLSEELKIYEDFPFSENLKIIYIIDDIKEIARDWIKELKIKNLDHAMPESATDELVIIDFIKENILEEEK